jgi:proteic killer suppression protein
MQKVFMIVSFGNKYTEKIWMGQSVRNLPDVIQTIGRRKLRMLNNSQNLKDLSIPPSNMLEKMKGKLSDYYSIRINDKWRIIFIWSGNIAEDVTIINYHK